MPGKIFINYRRDQSLDKAQLLAGVLEASFGKTRVFLDVHGIDGADNWLHTLDRQVDASDAVIALIGRGWADAVDENGNRRLDNPRDFVVHEIARAWSRDVPVLPVLIDGASMPQTKDLPQSLLVLTLLQAMPLRSETLQGDAEQIVRRLRVLISKRRRSRLPLGLAVAASVALFGIGMVVGPIAASRLSLLGIPIDQGRISAEAARDDAERRLVAQTERAVLEKEVQALALEREKRLRADTEATLAEANRRSAAAGEALTTETNRRRATEEKLAAAEDKLSAAEKTAARLRDEQRGLGEQLRQLGAELGSTTSRLETAMEKLKSLMGDRDEVRMHALGLTLFQQPFGAAGVLVFDVEPRSRADRAGLRRGDVILRVHGSAVSTPPDVEDVIASEARKGRRTADQLPIELRLKSGTGERRITIPPEPAARSFAPSPI